MAAQAPTIIDLKLGFLRSQIAALSRPISVPASFDARQPAHLAETEVLRQKHIDDALAQLNVQIRKHSKLAYSQIAQRHVAEQIDALYWRAGDRSVRDGKLGDEALVRGADFTQSSSIAALPADWDEVGGEDEEASTNYRELVLQLQTLDSKRQELLKKVETYKMLKAAVDPLSNPREDVQPNLCTKNGELEVELEKMRTLLARFAGRVSGLEAKAVDRADGDVEMADEGEKLRELLALP